jgi:pimeloyl-ACP methyl ester carboxylesterase
MSRRWTTFATIGALVAGLLSTAPAVAAGTSQGPPVPKLAWHACENAEGYECATAKVPLDYDDPHGPTIDLAVSRIRATDPKHRIGSLFLNPGGPGGSGVEFLQGVGGYLYSDEVRAKFDLISFDPRGVAGSTPLTCFKTQEQADAATAPFGFPVTPAEERAWMGYDKRYAKSCAHYAGPIIDHMSTADVARDMDALRQAVGDKKLTYAGYSYGTYLGSVYANMFPDKVRAIIIDGVIDPVSDATGRGLEFLTKPVDARLESEQGAYQELQEFLRLCKAGGKNCSFSAGSPKARFDALAARLRKHPLELPDGDGGTYTVTYADMIGTTLGSLYSAGGFEGLADYLQGLDTAKVSAIRAAKAKLSRPALAQAKPARLADDPAYTQGAEGFYGVWCTDSLIPSYADAWTFAARAADRKWPYFGRAWNWESSVCVRWPGHDSDRYLGPFNKKTSAPVLVIGNRWDPATRYEDAVSTSKLLGNARLLSVSGWGHTSLFSSTCADNKASAYLLTGALPKAGTVCKPDEVPFAQSSRLRAAKNVPPFQWRPPSR